MSNRNTNAHFELAPQAQIERSTFTRDFNVKTSFNVGELVPFYVDEVLPGDTFSVETSKALRLQTLITPVMDNLYIDFYYFFVPNRLVWNHWQEFMGQDDPQAWNEPVSYTIPKIRNTVSSEKKGYEVGTLADYMGLPTGVTVDNISQLPFRAYCKIWNDWFRDENLQDPVYFPLNDTDIVVQSTDTATYKGLSLLKANKFHDYFTSCLPAPQKGLDSDFSLLSGLAPVVTSPSLVPLDSFDQDYFGRYPVVSDYYSNLDPTGYHGSLPMLMPEKFIDYDDKMTYMDVSTAMDGIATSDSSYREGNIRRTIKTDYISEQSFAGARVPGNLWANLSYAPNLTINDLRRSFAIQRMLEKDARGGTRYIELLKSHFGVSSPDARLQRSEYLGGDRMPFNIQQCLQTSETQTTPLGDVSGWSLTSDSHFDFTKSFTEHGFVIGLACARYDHTYQQGIERFWSRRDKYDFFWPALAHIGEQAVKVKEIYANDSAVGDNVFGYQEAWAEYRYKPNLVTGEMRSQYAQSLDCWHFADDYDSQPQLSSSWIQEDGSNVNRCLSVTSQNQIFGDILVTNKCTRPMPMYSIPGLIDHF